MIKKCSDYLFEKLGINEDGEILADFLINFLMKAKPGNTYIFVNPDLVPSPLKEGFEEDFIDIIKKLNDSEFPNDEKDKLITKAQDILMQHPELQKFIKKEPKKDPIIINEMPKLSKKVYKIYVNYITQDMSGVQAFFDPMNSKYTKNGYIMHFTFLHKKDKDKIWKHYIYHEIHHGIQYLKMGKKKMIFIHKNIRNNIMKDLIKGPPYDDFLHLLYFTINVEQGAFIPEFYGKIKYRKNIKSIEDLKKYFSKRDIYEYRTAYNLANVDIEKLFNIKIKNLKTGEIKPLTNKEQMKIFFTLLKKIGRELKTIKDEKELHEYLKIKGVDLQDKDMISDIELNATMKKYTKYFNKIGEKLIKKIDKTYPLLHDYYIKKFEKNASD